jgi:hypothetical protein
MVSICFGILNLCHKVLSEVLVNDPVAGGKKSQYVGNEMSFTVIQILPIAKIMTQIYFFGCPKARFSLLVKFPDVMVSNGEKDKPVLVFLQNWFFESVVAHDVKGFKRFNQKLKGIPAKANTLDKVH